MGLLKKVKKKSTNDSAEKDVHAVFDYVNQNLLSNVTNTQSYLNQVSNSDFITDVGSWSTISLNTQTSGVYKILKTYYQISGSSYTKTSESVLYSSSRISYLIKRRTAKRVLFYDETLNSIVLMDSEKNIVIKTIKIDMLTRVNYLDYVNDDCFIIADNNKTYLLKNNIIVETLDTGSYVWYGDIIVRQGSIVCYEMRYMNSGSSYYSYLIFDNNTNKIIYTKFTGSSYRLYTELIKLLGA